MKYVLSLLLLTLLVSCSDKEETVSRTCTLNDQPIDCAYFDQTSSQTGGTTEPTDLELSVSITVGYEIKKDDNGNPILVFEKDSKVESLQGNHCIVSTVGVSEFKAIFYAGGNTLELTPEGGESEDYRRIDGPFNEYKLRGVWKGRTIFRNNAEHFLTFNLMSKDKATITNKCKF